MTRFTWTSLRWIISPAFPCRAVSRNPLLRNACRKLTFMKTCMLTVSDDSSTNSCSTVHFEIHAQPSGVYACMKVYRVIWRCLEIPCNTKRCYGWHDLQHIPWFNCNCRVLFLGITFKKGMQGKWSQLLNHLFTRNSFNIIQADISVCVCFE